MSKRKKIHNPKKGRQRQEHVDRGSDPLFRPITHTEYTGINKLLDNKNFRLQKVIREYDGAFDMRNKMYNPLVMTDKNFKMKGDKTGPIVYGVPTLLFAIWGIYIYIRDGEWEDNFHLWLIVFCWIFSIVSAIFYFTMPNKDIIYDRIRGTVTLPARMWKKSVTMPFDKVRYGYRGASTGGLGYTLMAARPTTIAACFIGLGLGTCFDDLSFITWYMDKNRPLPPFKDLDPYREQDFERRKAERFPKPLYPSEIETPEFAPEQQKERRRIGVW